MILHTTSGDLPVEEAGVILVHEHIFTDLRGPDTPGYATADAEDVIHVMKPLLEDAKRAGVDVLVECTSIGVGRNVPLVARVAEEAGLRVIVPTGVYTRGEFAPEEFEAMTEEELEDWMVREINAGIDDTGIKAGFIKLACDKTALTPLQKRLLRAAAKTSRKTGCAVASHTPGGAHAIEQADILMEHGAAPDRFIWVHTQSEPDLEIHKQVAARGCYLEYDCVGGKKFSDEELIRIIRETIDAGFADRILLSHDAGWYQPGKPNGGTQRGFTYLTTEFIPRMREAGLSEEIIRRLTIENPRRAFGIPEKP